MKKVKGGHGYFCEYPFTCGPGQWYYPTHNESKIPVQHAIQNILNELTDNCEEDISPCTGHTNQQNKNAIFR